MGSPFFFLSYGIGQLFQSAFLPFLFLRSWVFSTFLISVCFSSLRLSLPAILFYVLEEVCFQSRINCADHNDCRSKDSRSSLPILCQSFLPAVSQFSAYRFFPISVVLLAVTIFRTSFGGYIIISPSLFLSTVCSLFSFSLFVGLLLSFPVSAQQFLTIRSCFFYNITELFFSGPVLVDIPHPDFTCFSFFLLVPLRSLVPGAE